MQKKSEETDRFGIHGFSNDVLNPVSPLKNLEGQEIEVDNLFISKNII